MRGLLASDSPNYPTSYSNIVKHFAHEMSERGHSIAFGGFQSGGHPTLYRFRGRDYPLYGLSPPTRLADAVSDFDPDVIIHVRDFLVHVPRFFPQSYTIKGGAVNGAPVFQWVPVQHERVPWDYVDALHREADVVMPFTRYGGEVLANAGLVRDRIEPLPLGVSDAYSDPEGPAAEAYGRTGVPIIMSVGLGGQDRKAFPLLMRAYTEIMGEFDADFYLHTVRIGAFDLEEHVRMSGSDGHWLFPHVYDPSIGYPEEDLARRYRAARAYVSVGTGEGWDMPLSEACALGRAVVFPREGNRLEVTGDYEGPKFPVSTFALPRNYSWERMMDVDHLADQLLRLKDARPDPAAGRDYYSRHSWARTVDRFLQIASSRGIS